ncbi:hypothetical protein ACMDCR_22125 [Labrys okinawensis]|uniref:hypothetical protein n=1 Tax=Labrys okinawensis TaxID=346911 RepID=UPI0039BCAAC2
MKVVNSDLRGLLLGIGVLIGALSTQPAQADDFGQIGTMADLRGSALWLSATGDSYESKIIITPHTTSPPLIQEVRYRFRLSQEEVRRVSDYLRRHDIWHTDCNGREGTYDFPTFLIWQKQGGVLREACQSGAPARPGPNFEALYKLLWSLDGGSNPPIEIYRSTEPSDWVPPGFPNVSAWDIAKISR